MALGLRVLPPTRRSQGCGNAPEPTLGCPGGDIPKRECCTQVNGSDRSVSPSSHSSDTGSDTTDNHDPSDCLSIISLSRYFESVTRVYSVIFFLQRRCTGCRVPFSDPRCFLLVRYHSRALGAHVLATVVEPSPNGPQFCHIRYIRPGGVTQVDHESAQLSRLEAVVVASPNSPASPDITPMAS